MPQYDICVISAPGDAGTAERLADSLRRYRPPAVAAGSDYQRRISVDATGSPVDTPVRQLLDDSRFLVVLCSPEAKSHPGILDRLAYFRVNHDSEHIAAVLVEGEPADSFPENFSEEKLVRHIMPDMSIVSGWRRSSPSPPIFAEARALCAAVPSVTRRYASPPPSWGSTPTFWNSVTAPGADGPRLFCLP
ncbi:MAG: hypothetical protein IJH47_07095 [Oscillospiraceae bacterium]|nr:hypothetical protein [Oscillospiraceae bacterium]